MEKPPYSVLALVQTYKKNQIPCERAIKTEIHKTSIYTMFMSVLTHFSLMFHSYTPWKRKKIKGFLTFPGGIEMEHWAFTR